MNVLIVVVAVLAVVVGCFWYVGQKPAVHRSLTDEKLEQLLEVLLAQGHNGSLLLLQGRKSIPFIQVMKYESTQKVGLQLDFPEAIWAEPYLKNVRLVADRFGTRLLDSSDHAGAPMAFITLDFGVNVGEAAACVRSIAEDGLGLRLYADGRAHFRGVSSKRTDRID